MSSVAETVLEGLLDNAELVESISYVPAAGGDAVSVNALVDRLEVRRDDEDLRGNWLSREARLRVFATDHATHSGLVAPARGDNWTLPDVKGGTPHDNWKCRTWKGKGGTWDIHVAYREDRQGGGRSPGA